MHQHAKFRQNQFFKIAASGHLGFLNSGNNGLHQAGDASTFQISLKSVKWLQNYHNFFSIFQGGTHPPSRICLLRFWVLVVFTGVQYWLESIVVSII